MGSRTSAPPTAVSPRAMAIWTTSRTSKFIARTHADACGACPFIEPGALLDVGCAAGFFVDEASRHGWRARGVDVSNAMVEWGRRHVSADIRVGTLDDMPPDRIESCITMWDYIEHALDPRGDVEQAFSRLRPGGVLALSTGDAASALARLSLERWHLMTPRHHNYFFTGRRSGACWSRLGSRSSIWVTPRLFPLRYLAHKACLTLDLSILDALAGRLARSPFGARTVPVNLWASCVSGAGRPVSSLGGSRRCSAATCF